MSTLYEVKKHLQGKHPQKSHGGGSTRQATVHEIEGLEAISRLITTGGSSGTPKPISPEAEAFLKETVTKKEYKLYRGIGLINARVSSADQQQLNNAKVGDAAPKSLAKQGNNLASYTTKKGVANYYAEGKMGITIEAKVPAASVLADTSNIEKVLQRKGIKQNVFTSDDFDYFKSDREVIVREPIGQGIIIKKTGKL